MSTLELKKIRKSFGKIEVIRNVDLSVETGEFVVFVGPSGCGKSTLLRTIAGLENINSGSVEIDGEDVTDEEPYDRGIAMVFQSYALYPHMTVSENMAFALRLAGASKQERKVAVDEAARILQIEPLLDRKPAQLSGGQRQRVAIGRSIVRKPKVFLFDEPLSNLDAELRVQMRIEIARLHKKLGATMVYVTHDQTEAMTLADRIVVLRDGVIEQVGSPTDLFDDPDNVFVAGFIGSPSMNILPITVGNAATAKLGPIEFKLPKINWVLEDGEKLQIGIRPEHLMTDTGEEFELDIDVVEQLGSTSFVYAMIDADISLLIETRDMRPTIGEKIKVRFNPEYIYLFDMDGNRLR